MDEILGHLLVRTRSWNISLHGRDLGTFLSTDEIFAMKCPKISSVLRNVPKTCPCKEMSQNLVRTKKCPKISSVLRNVPRSRPCKEMSQDLVCTKKCPKISSMQNGQDFGTFLSTDEILGHFIAWTIFRDIS
jgi:hypothetical protein